MSTFTAFAEFFAVVHVGGPAVPAIGQDLGGLVNYVVHGTLHLDCPAEKDSLGHSLAPGNVTIDVAS
jgi:hypothetical protein